MVRPKISRPIFIILNGPNYIHWAQVMTSFLQARLVWRIVIEEITTPVPKKNESKKTNG